MEMRNLVVDVVDQGDGGFGGAPLAAAVRPAPHPQVTGVPWL